MHFSIKLRLRRGASTIGHWTFAFLLACAWLPAIASPAPEGLTVRLLSWHNDLENLSLCVGSETLVTQADEFVLGSELTFKRSAPSLTVSQLNPAPGPNEPTHRPLAEINLPAGATHAIILLAPAPAGAPLPYLGQALDDSPAAQPNETLRLFNFSTKTLALKFGAATSAIEPGTHQVVPYAVTGAPHTLLQLAIQSGDNWQMIRRGLQPTPPNRRILGFIRDGRLDRGNLDPHARARPVDCFFFTTDSRPSPLPTPPVRRINLSAD